MSTTGPAPAPFVVGTGRSGTTLLRLMLDAHPELAIPSETQFIPELAALWAVSDEPLSDVLRAISAYPRWPDFGVDVNVLERRLAEATPSTFGDVLRAFFNLYAENHGKPRWGDKSPSYNGHLALIASLLPEARFVHIVRDGRDVFVSVRDLWFGPASAEVAARWWRTQLEDTRRQAPNGYLEIRYEDLVTDPESTLRTVCDFLDLSWDPAMLRYYERAPARLAETHRDIAWANGFTVAADDRVGIFARTREPPDPSRISRWRAEMTQRERDRFNAIAGDVLERYGYETS
jgi:Sulfotransferase family